MPRAGFRLTDRNDGPMPQARTLRSRQHSRVFVMDIAQATATLIHESADRLYEAPNWTASGDLILNADGALWRLAPRPGSIPEPIPLEGVPELNNDHVLAPDGETVFVSANDGHIYAAPLAGGHATRTTPNDGDAMRFLHGVSPDGADLAYIRIDLDDAGAWGVPRLHTIGVDGASDTPLTDGIAPVDGAEYSPDGSWIYVNTEQFSDEPGHAQIARIRPDGSGLEQLTVDEKVNWFPHLSPDGTLAYYLSFPIGTTGHPADVEVELRLVRGGDWANATTLVHLFGGQGTANVNAWASDSRRFAYVDYPIGS